MKEYTCNFDAGFILRGGLDSIWCFDVHSLYLSALAFRG